MYLVLRVDMKLASTGKDLATYCDKNFHDSNYSLVVIFWIVVACIFIYNQYRLVFQRHHDMRFISHRWIKG